MNIASISIPTFLFSLACVVSAQPGPLDKPARVVAVDFSQVRGPFSTVWKECIGAGRANEGLRADWAGRCRCRSMEDFWGGGDVVAIYRQCINLKSGFLSLTC